MRSGHRLLSWLWVLVCTVLAVSGLGQMPIFKRYYIADLPGMAWTADFMFLHGLHYAAATVFLFLAFAWLGRRLAGLRDRFGGFDFARIGTVVLLVATGFVRVAKNGPGTWLDPTLVMIVDWTHLVAAIFLGILALIGLRGRRSPQRGDVCDNRSVIGSEVKI